MFYKVTLYSLQRRAVQISRISTPYTSIPLFPYSLYPYTPLLWLVFHDLHLTNINWVTVGLNGDISIPDNRIAIG